MHNCDEGHPWAMQMMDAFTKIQSTLGELKATQDQQGQQLGNLATQSNAHYQTIDQLQQAQNSFANFLHGNVQGLSPNGTAPEQAQSPVAGGPQ